MNDDEAINGEVEESTALEAIDMGALSATDRALIDIQISTAKKYPRSVDKALKECVTLATMDEETAASCFYALPRSGKTIEGPSVRLAEIMAHSWGNLRADVEIVGENGTHVTARATCFDLEKNIAFRVTTERRITDRKGRRYNDDMIGVTKNAASSVALRNAVFRVIPGPFVRRIYKLARRASIGEGGTTTQKRQAAIDWFAKLGVKPEQVFEILEVRGIDDIGEDELITLRGLSTAIKDGETSVEQVFQPSRHSEKTDELNVALRNGGDAELPTAADGSSEGLQPDESASSPAGRFLDLMDEHDLSPKKARKVLADSVGLADARKLKGEHYEIALDDIESFLALYRGDDSGDSITDNGRGDDSLPLEDEVPVGHA